LSSEWLENDLNEMGIWKLLSESLNSWMDVRVIRGDEEISPPKWLEERSICFRDVKFAKQLGKTPVRLLLLISRLWRCFNSHRPENYQFTNYLTWEKKKREISKRDQKGPSDLPSAIGMLPLSLQPFIFKLVRVVILPIVCRELLSRVEELKSNLCKFLREGKATINQTDKKWLVYFEEDKVRDTN